MRVPALQRFTHGEAGWVESILPHLVRAAHRAAHVFAAGGQRRARSL